MRLSAAWTILMVSLSVAPAQEAGYRYYTAAIAAAEASLRLHETAAAKHWLREAPAEHRGWEWRYLTEISEQSEAAWRGHDGEVGGVAIAPAGRIGATGGSDKLVKLWDLATRNLLHTLAGHTAGVSAVAFSSDGKLLASAASDGTVRIWNAETGAALRTLEGNGSGLAGLAWSVAGDRMAGSSWRIERGRGVVGILNIWEPVDGARLQGWEHGIKPIRALAFHPSGKQLAAGSWDGWVMVWDLPVAGAPRWEVRLPDDGRYPAVQSVAYSRDGRSLAVGGKDARLRLFDSSSGKLQSLMGSDGGQHTGWVNAAAWGLQDRWLASGSSDQSLRLWDPAGGRLLRVLHGHESAVNAVAARDADGGLLSGDAAGMLRLWPSQDLHRRSHSTSIYGISFSPNGDHLLTAAWGGTVKRWETAGLRELWEKPVHKDSANRVAHSPDGLRAVTGGNDGRLQLIDAQTGGQLETWEKVSDGRAAGIAWSRDGKLVCSPSSRPSAKLWDAARGRMLHTLTGGTGEVYGLDFSPDGRTVALGWTGGQLRVFDTAAPGEGRLLEGFRGGVYAISFAPGGSLMASAGADRVVRIWDTASWSMVREMPGHNELVYSVAFSPDGRRLATAGNDQTVRIWDPARGALLLTIPFQHQVYDARWHPGGDLLAVAPMDGSLVLLSGR